MWEYRADPPAPILGGPAIQDGLVLFGAENGNAYGLPWHLGRYVWAAGTWLVRRKRHIEAAECFAVARESSAEGVDAVHAEAAIAQWKLGSSPLLALRFREVALNEEPATIAAEYEDIAKAQPVDKGRHAARLYRARAKFFEKAEDQKGVTRCLQQARQRLNAPACDRGYGSICQVVGKPGTEGQVAIDLRNDGSSVARDIQLRLRRDCLARLWIGLKGELEPDETAEIAVPLRQLVPPLNC